MDIKSAKYHADSETGENLSITVVLNNAPEKSLPLSVPIDPANTHYAEIEKQRLAGTLTIADAD
tara:strand:+ start:492 stop:683 length:192 start_codon:yes stop_codon:yes gene_type:complete